MSKLTCLAALIMKPKISELRFAYTIALLAVLFSSAAVANDSPFTPDGQYPLISASVKLGSVNPNFESRNQSTDEWLSRYWSLDLFENSNESVSEQAPKKSGFAVDNQS